MINQDTTQPAWQKYRCEGCHRYQGFWSFLRSWLRPHRGISQEKLPLYLGFFQFVHNARIRGKCLLSFLLELLVV
jgi:transposase-like protein